MDGLDGPVAVRPFRPPDAAAVRALFSENAQSLAQDRPEPIRSAMVLHARQSLEDDLVDIWMHYMAPPGRHFLVAEVERTVAGMVGIDRVDAETAEVRRLSVAEPARRNGLGRRLLGAAEEWARAQGYACVEATTTSLQVAALALYESVGYQPCEAGNWGPLKLMRLRKDFAPLPAGPHRERGER